MAGPKAKVPGLPDEASKYILEIINQIAGEGAPRKITLQTDNYVARFNDIVRAAPQNQQLTIFFPAPSVQNQGGKVTIYVQNVSAPVVVVPKGGLVNGYTQFVLPSIGMYEFENDSKNWFTNVVAGLGGAGVAVQAGTNIVSTGTVNFSSANGLSFGLTGSTLTGSYTVPAVVNSGLLNVTDSAFSVNASRLAFTNTGNVSFSLSTGASGATLGALVATSLTNIKVSAGASSANLSALTFSNSNNMSWGLDGSTVTGQPFFLASQVGGSSVNATRLAFSNASNVFFGLSTGASGATLTASIATSLTAINISAGATSANLSAVTFSNSNGLAFGLTNSIITGSYTVPAVVNSGLLQVSNTATSNNVSRLAFLDSNGLTFGFSTGGSVGTITAAYSVPSVVNSGMLNASAGGSSANVSQLIFTNTNNVGFALSTAAGSVATLRAAASFNFSAGGSSNNISAVTFANSNNMSWGLSTAGAQATLTAMPFMFVSGSASNNVTALHFANNASASFLMSTGASAATFAVSVAPSTGGGATPPPGIALTATNQSLELVTGTGADVDYQVTYEDLSSGSLTPGSSQGSVTTATTTSIQAAPAASTQRIVVSITITNKDVTAQTVTVQKDVATSNFILAGPYSIPASGGRLEYTPDQGFRVFNADGSEFDGSDVITGEVTKGADSTVATVTRSTDYDTSPWTGPHQFDDEVTINDQLRIDSVYIDGDFTDADGVVVTPGDVVVLDLTSSATGDPPHFLDSIVPPTAGQRCVILVYNSATVVNRDILIRHQATTGTTAANRIICPDQQDYYLQAGGGVWMYYDPSPSRWRVIGAVNVPPGITEPSGTDARAYVRGPSSRSAWIDQASLAATFPAGLTAAGLVELATAAEVGTASDNTRAVTPLGLTSHNGIAKCWGSWAGNTTTLDDSYNISSLVDSTNGTTVNIATAFNTANWMVLLTTEQNTSNLVGNSYVAVLSIASKTTNQIVTRTFSLSNPPAAGDPGRTFFLGIGDQ